MSWLLATLLALFSFGLWGFFTKLAILTIDARSALIFQTIGVLLIGLITLTLIKFKPATDLKGVSYAILTGIAYGIGCLSYFIAADKGKIITVVTLTALYPLVTIFLAYLFLNETVTIKQSVGIVLALVAIYFLSQ